MLMMLTRGSSLNQSQALGPTATAAASSTAGTSDRELPADADDARSAVA